MSAGEERLAAAAAPAADAVDAPGRVDPAAASADALPRSEPAGGRMPDFFVVGHPKSGTTALYEMLRSHPQIFMSAEKEPWFLSRELEHRPPPRKPFALPDSLEQYMSLFAGAAPGQLAGEASTTYLWSRTAAPLIAQLQPRARAIAILREPASFLHSLHLQFVESYIETEHDFAAALALEDERRHGRHIARHSYWPQLLLYSEHVAYVEQLRRYEAALPADQILVLIYDDFRSDNDGTLRRVLRFLGVDEQVAVAAVEANPTVMSRSRRLHHLVHAVSVGRGPVSRAAKRSIQAVTPRSLRRGALQAVRDRVVYAEPQPPDERLMAELRRRFKPEVEALGEHLGRDLVALWGYDRIA